MSNDTRYLRIALIVFGLVFLFGVLPLAMFWPSGWVWNDMGHHAYYLQMIMAIYAVLGVFLLLAARDPLKHLSLIWFTVWSSLAHAAVMAVQSFTGGGQHMGHLLGDVPALLVVAVVLAVLTLRSSGAKAMG